METITKELTIDNFSMDVVIPHLNCEYLRKCLETLRKHTPENVLKKVILIDQNEKYQEVDDLVDIHVKTKNLGFARGNNLGIRISQAPYVMVLNDDVIFLNKKWIEGIIETFNRYNKQALGVNPSSPRNPRASGAEPIDHVDFPYKEDLTDEEYDRMVNELGKGHIMDGICTWGTVFNRSKLEQVGSVIPGQCYFNEAFVTGGGEDYFLNYMAYLTKNEDNDFRGYRMLGTGLSFVYHYWYSTKREGETEGKVKYDGNFHKLCGLWEGDNMIEAPDIFGQKGIKKIVKNIIREDD